MALDLKYCKIVVSKEFCICEPSPLASIRKQVKKRYIFRLFIQKLMHFLNLIYKKEIVSNHIYEFSPLFDFKLCHFGISHLSQFVKLLQYICNTTKTIFQLYIYIPPKIFPVKSFFQVSQKELTGLLGCGIKSMLPIFETAMLIYQSKANLDVNILFGRITHLNPEMSKK